MGIWNCTQTIKKAAVDCLATYGVEKTNPEFKDLWGFIYRGAEFALVSAVHSIQRA